MTTDEKREKLIKTCLIGNKAPYNECSCCEISESCRHAGHPPEYMKDDIVEMVYNDAVQIKALTAKMTVREMRNELTRVCDLVTAKDCRNGACPIGESCDKYSEDIPEETTAEQVKAVYADLVRLGKFKEEKMPREKPAFREVLDRLDAAFPGREIIQKKELSQFLGLDVRTVKKYFSACESKLHPGYCKTKIARILAD